MATPEPKNPPTPAPDPNAPTPGDENPPAPTDAGQLMVYLQGEFAKLNERIDGLASLIGSGHSVATTSPPPPPSVTPAAAAAPATPPAIMKPIQDGDIVTVEGKKMLFRERREGSGWKSEFVDIGSD